MKAIVDKVFILIVTLLGMTDAFAAPHPPSPGSKTTTPPPPGLPIDENISFLLIMAMLFGIYIIYRYQLSD
jgi:hypothetical protein